MRAIGGAEIARREIERQTKMQGWNLTDWKITDKVTWLEIERQTFKSAQ